MRVHDDQIDAPDLGFGGGRLLYLVEEIGLQVGDGEADRRPALRQRRRGTEQCRGGEASDERCELGHACFLFPTMQGRLSPSATEIVTCGDAACRR